MIATTIALVVATLLCLAFDATKWIGVAGVVLLFCLHPLLFTSLSVLGGVAYFCSTVTQGENAMNCQNYLLDAIDQVLAWDLPDDALADAVKVQASLMARINPEDCRELCSG